VPRTRFSVTSPMPCSVPAAVRSRESASARSREGESCICVWFSARGEVKLPSVGGRGGFFGDWILALVDESKNLQEFVAVEVQSIDTTGNYRKERDAYAAGHAFTGSSRAGINWENVNKRILPQLIFKGHVLRRETSARRVSSSFVRHLCTKR